LDLSYFSLKLNLINYLSNSSYSLSSLSSFMLNLALVLGADLVSYKSLNLAIAKNLASSSS